MSYNLFHDVTRYISAKKKTKIIESIQSYRYLRTDSRSWIWFHWWNILKPDHIKSLILYLLKGRQKFQPKQNMDGDFVTDSKSNRYFFKEINVFINEIFLKRNASVNKTNFSTDSIFWYIENASLNSTYRRKTSKSVCGSKVYNLIIARIAKGAIHVHNDTWKMYVLHYIEIKRNCNKH